MPLQIIVQALLGLSLVACAYLAYWGILLSIYTIAFAPVFAGLVLFFSIGYCILVIKTIQKIYLTHTLFPQAYVLLACAIVVMLVGYSLYKHNRDSSNLIKGNEALGRQLFDTAPRDFVCTETQELHESFITKQNNLLTYVYKFNSYTYSNNDQIKEITKPDEYGTQTLGSFVDEKTIKDAGPLSDRFSNWDNCKNKDGKTIFDVYTIINK